MSTLVENVAKVTAAHAALRTAIAAKGVAVPDGTKLTGMSTLVEQIQTEPVPTNPRAAFAGDDATSIVVSKTMVVDMTATKNLSYYFYQCAVLTSLVLPEGFGQSVTNLRYCFSNCNVLTSLSLPAGFGQSATDLNNCFSYCRKLTSLSLPAGFGQSATDLNSCFYQCWALALVLPAGFGQNATDLNNCFYQCTIPTSLAPPAGFGQNATTIRHCFSSCTRLSSLVLPEGFGTNAADLERCFNYCVALTSLTLPAGFGQNATSLNHCFDSCSNLTDITGNPNFKASLDLSPCTNLTHDSLMVVINGLQAVTTTQKLTLGATNLAKLTDAEKKVATDKGWTLA